MDRAPWHYWIVALLALLFYGLGAAEYVGVKYGIAAIVEFYGTDMVAYFSSLALAADISWAIGIWAGFFGAIVMIGRGKAAASLFAVAFAGLFIMSAILIFRTEAPLTEVIGPDGIYIALAELAIAFLFFVYARWMNVRQTTG